MIDRELAKAKASNKLKEIYTDFNVLITGEAPLGDVGWLFGYDSKKYIEEDDGSAMLLGNGPLLVTNEGKIYEAGTGMVDMDECLKNYKEGHFREV